jgi:hypothetical protein
MEGQKHYEDTTKMSGCAVQHPRIEGLETTTDTNTPDKRINIRSDFCSADRGA